MFQIPFNPPTTIRVNLTGQRFSRLVVYALYARHRHQTYWLCRCDCGKWTLSTTQHLRNKSTQSCKCLYYEVTGQGPRTHGYTSHDKKSAEYRSWQSARQRCNNPNDKSYKNYGGRGIKFCFDSYPDFLAYMGVRPTPQHTIDRIDNNGHYEKGNVRWATKTEQVRNRTNTVFLTIHNETRPLIEWCDIFNIHHATVRHRITKLQWSHEKAVTYPVRFRRHC